MATRNENDFVQAIADEFEALVDSFDGDGIVITGCIPAADYRACARSLLRVMVEYPEELTAYAVSLAARDHAADEPDPGEAAEYEDYLGGDN